MAQLAACELCDETAEVAPRSADEYDFSCPACGKYAVSGQWRAAKMKSHLGQDALVRLRGVVSNETHWYGRFGELITTGSVDGVLGRSSEPNGPLDQMDRLLAIVAERTPFVGAQAQLGRAEPIARRLYLPDANSVIAVLAHLQTSELLGLGDRGPQNVKCTLTLKGWERADRLRHTPKAGDQAFVAMWFHAAMDVLFDEGFLPALRACGYSAYRVDRVQHGNKIDDEIIANLLKSRIVVADLTGMRPNVFYEAGFAMGRGIPIVLTCSQDYMGHFVTPGPNDAAVPTPLSLPWFKQVSDHAFDVRQYPIIQWVDPPDLAQKLQMRLEAQQLTLGPAR